MEFKHHLFLGSLLAGYCQAIAQAQPVEPSGNAVTSNWEQTVDYGDPGYYETGNAWRTWPFGEAVGGGYRYLSHYDRNRPRVGSAFWTAVMPVYGKYKVSVSFRKTENRTNDADYELYQCKGICDDQQLGTAPIFTTSLNQRIVPTDGNLTWVALGEYIWAANQQVIVHLDGTDDNQSDAADAAKWELLEELVPPPKVLNYPAMIPVIQLLLN